MILLVIAFNCIFMFHYINGFNPFYNQMLIQSEMQISFMDTCTHYYINCTYFFCNDVF